VAASGTAAASRGLPDWRTAPLASPTNDDLKALVVLEQAGIEFGLDGAGGRSTGKAGQTDFLRDACVEFQHGMGPMG